MMLSIIFVNWNSTAYLRECITSIHRWTSGIPFEIIVVDNASPAADVDVLKEQFGQITLLKSPYNLGFARANNLGFRHSRGDVLLFLNPDTKLISAAINTLLQRLISLPDAGILGCRLLNDDLSVQTSCIQRFPTILNQALDIDVLRNRWPNSPLWGIAPLFSTGYEPASVEVISGACMMIKRQIFEQVGLFNEDYFMYAEDLELSYKVTRAGYHNYFIGEATMIHYGGKSSTPEQATASKWKSILRYVVNNHGYLYACFFKFVMICVAAGRLTVIALLSIKGKTPVTKTSHYSVSSKWSAILKTLLCPLPSLKTARDTRS